MHCIMVYVWRKSVCWPVIWRKNSQPHFWTYSGHHDPRNAFLRYPQGRVMRHNTPMSSFGSRIMLLNIDNCASSTRHTVSQKDCQGMRRLVPSSLSMKSSRTLPSIHAKIREIRGLRSIQERMWWRILMVGEWSWEGRQKRPKAATRPLFQQRQQNTHIGSFQEPCIADMRIYGYIYTK